MTETKGRKTLNVKGPRVLRRKCQRYFLPGAVIDTATPLNLKSATPLQILRRRFTDHFLEVQCPWLLCFTPCLSCAVALLGIDCRPSFDRIRYLRRRPWCLRTVVKRVLENCARIPYLRVPTISRLAIYPSPVSG